MDNDFEIIIQLIFLLFFIGALFFPFLLFFIYVFYQNSKRKKIRARTQNSYNHLIGSNQAIPVRYASEPRFNSWLKVFPWEAAGVLVPSRGCVTFVGENLNGTPLNLQFSPADSSILWLGKCPWPNGAVSWFAFDARGLKHYFSSETGAFVFGSHASTTTAYQQAQQSFGLQGVQR